ncbi:MAG: hypothetical protein WC812_02850 [Candidatus Pacearchaeota archaeon]|jgi:hypothetical protein
MKKITLGLFGLLAIVFSLEIKDEIKFGKKQNKADLIIEYSENNGKKCTVAGFYSRDSLDSVMVKEHTKYLDPYFEINKNKILYPENKSFDFYKEKLSKNLAGTMSSEEIKKTKNNLELTPFQEN